MKAQSEYHDKTPELAERLGKDIAAALRLGLTDITVTTVPYKGSVSDVKVRYYFEASFPGANQPKPSRDLYSNAVAS